MGLTIPSTPDSEFYRYRPHELTRVGRLRLEYPIDQTANRDRYRAALLRLQQARRDLSLLLDEVYLDVRQTYRELLRASRSYEIRLRSVQIAARRRRLAVLQQKQGQASARDVLEAEEALRNSQNGLTNAIVTYTTTRLRFLASLGMIGVDEDGRLYQREKPTRFDRLADRYRYLHRSPEENHDGDI
jgi:outer membrane protein TolC